MEDRYESADVQRERDEQADNKKPVNKQSKGDCYETTNVNEYRLWRKTVRRIL